MWTERSYLSIPFALLVFAECACPAHAQQNLTWDVNGPSGGTGGTGAWNTTSPFWFNGVSFQAWNNATFDNAIFGGFAGTVTLATPTTRTI
jgi:fibronectin-binding autotransporter adhesin